MFFLDDALIYQMNHIDKYVYIWMSLNSNRHAYVHICKLINLYLKLLLKISDLHLMFRIIFTSKKYKKNQGFHTGKAWCTLIRDSYLRDIYTTHAHRRQKLF